MDIARLAIRCNDPYRCAAMESASNADYASVMGTTDIICLLGSALRTIRLRTTKTQDKWAERTGMAQSYLSAVERGQRGWESLRTIVTAVEAAGEDPLELLRLAVAEVELPEDQRELMALWGGADDRTRSAILTLLRGQAQGGNAAAAR